MCGRCALVLYIQYFFSSLVNVCDSSWRWWVLFGVYDTHVRCRGVEMCCKSCIFVYGEFEKKPVNSIPKGQSTDEFD